MEFVFIGDNCEIPAYRNIDDRKLRSGDESLTREEREREIEVTRTIFTSYYIPFFPYIPYTSNNEL